MDRFSLFKECFPEIPICREAYERICGECDVIEHEDKGFALIKGNELRLVCVSEKYRRQGIGSELVRRAEEHIRSKGFDKIYAGGFSSGLLIGVPAESVDASCPFWEKRGYVRTGSCAEMKRSLLDFNASEYDIPVPEGVSFGISSVCPELKAAVAAVEEDWVQYFEDCEVFCGYINGEIASFCILGDDETCLISDGKRTGSVGCVGTVPKFRRQGIGLKMVAMAMDILKERGCESCFIHYTSVYDWYAKLGCGVFLWEVFLEKQL
ncbi:MAG: GNAT family N-acetyltransferase [Oscillospiraceae bacterium]|nr:GNAT family N-acetyltransferase [Oscillospiraceae bacterium]